MSRWRDGVKTKRKSKLMSGNIVVFAKVISGVAEDLMSCKGWINLFTAYECAEEKI